MTILNKLFRSTILGLLLVSTQFAFSMPTPFVADYSVTKGNMKLGNLHTSLKIQGNKYTYHKYTKSSGLTALLTKVKISENTEGLIAGDSIKPLRYLLNKSQRNKSKVDKIQFKSNKASGSYKGKAYSLSIPGNTQDRASLELVLARDIALNKAQLNYSVVEKGKIKKYLFQKLGHEKVQTPAGNFNAIKVKVARKGKKRETIFWLAKEINYMPVKVQHREKNDVITTILKRYTKN